MALTGAETGSSALGPAGMIFLLQRYEWNVVYLVVQQQKPPKQLMCKQFIFPHGLGFFHLGGGTAFSF